jgi:hypothetical protein
MDFDLVGQSFWALEACTSPNQNPLLPPYPPPIVSPFPHSLVPSTVAATAQRCSYKGKVRVLGERHPDTLSALFNLGILQSAKHEFSAAEETFSEVARRRFETLGSHSRDALRSLVALADVQKDAGKVRCLALGGEGVALPSFRLTPRA